MPPVEDKLGNQPSPGWQHIVHHTGGTGTGMGKTMNQTLLTTWMLQLELLCCMMSSHLVDCQNEDAA